MPTYPSALDDVLTSMAPELYVSLLVAEAGMLLAR